MAARDMHDHPRTWTTTIGTERTEISQKVKGMPLRTTQRGVALRVGYDTMPGGGAFSAGRVFWCAEVG